LVPAATINDTARTVRINNPALGPQYSENIDLSLEYYLKPAGLFSIGYFKKDLSDYIVTRDIGIVPVGVNNGFDGDYDGYTLQSQANSGAAKISGYEFDYRQQLTFLPGLLEGLSFSANFTLLSTEGDYGGTVLRSTEQIVDFVPESGNASLTYAHGKFGANILLNYTGRYLDAYSDDPSRLSFRASRTIVNVGVSYRVRPQLTVFCDVMNVFNEPQRLYRSSPSRPSQILGNDPAMTFGISGRF
jgi:TonB-dependent receptor